MQTKNDTSKPKDSPEQVTGEGCPGASCSASSELLENLGEWGEHFREKQHGATLTILRARKTIIDQSARIAWLENQWEETKELLHAVGSGRADSRLKQAADLMRDAMRHKPEVWNHAIDYYAAISSPNSSY
jgi:hypothetical protein